MLPKFIEECNRLLPDRAAYSTRYMGLSALHVSLNNSSTRTVRQLLKRNNDHLINLITLKFEWNGDIASGERRTKLFWNLHPKPKTVSELKVALEKISDNFPQVQLIKLSWVLQIVWQEYVNGDGRHSKHLSVLKKCSHLRRCAVLNSWDNFW